MCVEQINRKKKRIAIASCAMRMENRECRWMLELCSFSFLSLFRLVLARTQAHAKHQFPMLNIYNNNKNWRIIQIKVHLIGGKQSGKKAFSNRGESECDFYSISVDLLCGMRNSA